MHSAVLVLLCCSPAILRWIVAPDYPGTDDAFIHAAIIENIHEGAGWGVNAGDRVFMTTSPLFTAGFVCLRACTHAYMEIGMALSLLAGMTAIAGVYTLARLLGGARGSSIPLAAAALAAANLHLWRWSGAFIEASFVAAAVIWLLCWYYFLIERTKHPATVGWLLLGAACGLLVLLRPETGLLIPVLGTGVLTAKRPHIGTRVAALASGAAFVLLAAGFALFVNFGDVLPSTFFAKSEHRVLWINTRVWTQLGSVITTGYGGAALCACVVPVLLWRRSSAATRERLRLVLPLLLFPLAGCLFYSLKLPSLQSAGRYTLPFLISVPSVVALASQFSDQRLWTRLVLCVAGVQFAVALWLHVSTTGPVLRTMRSGYVESMRACAGELNRRAFHNDSVLVYMDIGVISLERRPDIRIVDAAGLASPWLQNLELSNIFTTTSTRFVIESLGTEDRYVEKHMAAAGVRYREVWNRSFPSPALEGRGAPVTVRLFEIAEK